jgi:hypothetical protein
MYVFMTFSLYSHVCIHDFLFIFRCTYCVLFILDAFSLYSHVCTCTHYLGIIFKCTHCVLFKFKFMHCFLFIFKCNHIGVLFIFRCNHTVLLIFRYTHYFSILDGLYGFSVASIVMKFLHEIQFHRLLSNYF